MFSNGLVECVEPREQLRPAGITTLITIKRVSLKEQESLKSTGLISICRTEDKKKDIVVIGGEGGMGSDGFVAVTDLANQLQWLAFFDFSNPFVSVELLNEEIIGTNNLGEKWRFPLKNPSKIRIETPAKPG